MTPHKKLFDDLKSDIEDIQKDACRMLAHEGDHSALASLREISSTSPNASIRYFSHKAINSILKRCGPEPHDDTAQCDLFVINKKTGAKKIDRHAFQTYLSSPDKSTRLDLMKTAMDSADAKDRQWGAQELARHLPDVLDPVEKSVTIKAVGTLGNSSNIEVLLPFLHDDDARVRADTVEALEYIGDPSVCPAIVPLLQDGDNRVQANAAVALKLWGKAQALSSLGNMLDSPNLWMRASAAHALREFKGIQAQQCLLKRLKVESSLTIYFKIVESLARMGTRSDIPRLKRYLAVEKDERKVKMLQALLKKLQGHTVDFSGILSRDEYDRAASEVEAHRPRVGDTVTGFVRENRAGYRDELAAEGTSGTEETPVRKLLAELSNPDEKVRVEAAVKLMKLDDAQVIPALKKAAESKDNIVRYYAKKALRSMQEREISPEKNEEQPPPFHHRFTLKMGFSPVTLGALLVMIGAAAWFFIPGKTVETRKPAVKKTPVSSFERLNKSSKRFTGVGQTVTWSGLVQDVNRHNRVVILRQNRRVFSAALPPNVPCNFVRGDILEVTGKVEDRNVFGAIQLKASAVRLVKPNKTGRKVAQKMR